MSALVRTPWYEGYLLGLRAAVDNRRDGLPVVRDDPPCPAAWADGRPDLLGPGWAMYEAGFNDGWNDSVVPS